MRITRSEKHKRRTMNKKAWFISLSSFFFAATVGATTLPQPTFGLLTETVQSEGIHTLSSLEVFPLTLREMVDDARELFDRIQFEWLNGTGMVTMHAFAWDTDEKDGETSDDGLAQLQSQVEQLQAILEYATQQYEEISMIHEDLYSYDTQFTDDAIRAKLLLEDALIEIDRIKEDAELLIAMLQEELEELLLAIVEYENGQGQSTSPSTSQSATTSEGGVEGDESDEGSDADDADHPTSGEADDDAKQNHDDGSDSDAGLITGDDNTDTTNNESSVTDDAGAADTPTHSEGEQS